MIYGCIGEKLGHSFSKEIHAKIADYKYELCEIEKQNLDVFMQTRDFKAINVTIPYKQAVIPHLYYISDTAKKIGAVNTIVNKDGKLYGYNTDFYGMSRLISKAGINFGGKCVLICGSGGTSKTAYAVAESLGAKKIIKASRSEKDGFVTYHQLKNLKDEIEIIINTTPAGMFPNSDTTCVDVSDFKNLCGVIDAVYNPLTTRLVREARNLGIKADCGLYMLVAQAVRASEIFLDTEYPDEIYDNIYNEILSSKRSVVLVGMPGCGKSTIGKILAEETGKEFFDSDEEIIKQTGTAPSDIIKNHGEAYFRDIESSIIKELSDKNGVIIATGGGAVLRSENVTNLKKNGFLVFLDRDISTIVPTLDRPLSCDADKLKKLYDSRYPIYTSVADIIIKSTDSPETTAEAVRRETE